MATRPVRFVFLAGLIVTLALVNVKLFAAGGPWWRGWADQKAYLASAQAFARFDFDPGRHWYPLAFPLTGAPFVPLLAAPFVPVGLACYALAFSGFRRVCAALGVGNVASVLSFLAATLLDPRIAKLWIEPWTTTLSAALIWVALGALADRLTDKGKGGVPPRLLGAVLMLIPLVRPADLVISVLLGMFLLPSLWRMRQLVPVATGAAVALFAYAALHLAIYGAHWPDYVLLSAEYGLNLRDLGWKAVVLLVEPKPWFPGETGLLVGLPWLVPGLAGLLLSLLDRERRRIVGPLLAIAIAYAVVLIAYVDLLPSGLWRFNNVHYFKWLLPLFALGVLLLIRAARSRPALTVATLALLLLPMGLRYRAVPVAADAPAKAVLLAPAGEDWVKVYQARSSIRDRAGVLRNYFDMHQLRRADGRILGVALKRPFAGAEQWQADDAGAFWPVGSPADPLALKGAASRAPIEHLGARLGWGLPCWLPQACDQALAE